MLVLPSHIKLWGVPQASPHKVGISLYIYKTYSIYISKLLNIFTIAINYTKYIEYWKSIKY